VDVCREEVPEFREVMPGRHVACHLVEQNVDGTIDIPDISEGR
jgi:hypothetical protein